MIRAVVTDIEGTTSSLSFVKDVLFPYARARIADYVRRHHQEAAVQAQLREAAEIAGVAAADTEAVIAALVRWIDEDRKITPLKALQGLIWEQGYARGDFHGHIYADARQRLQDWHREGVALYVFSSGSVHAQKLLFAHTEYGDLTPWFSGYFDTRIGSKQEVEAYREISASIGRPPETLLFLSDIRQELDAARRAGLHTLWLVREGPLDAHPTHRQVRDFSEIDLAHLGG